MRAMVPELSVVIPAYNEATRLGPSLEKALAYLERRDEPFEILVVDDGSRDATSEVARQVGDPRIRVLRLPENRGKGAVVRTGLLASLGGKVLITDADFSTPIEEIEKLEALLPRFPLVLGSRAVADADIRERQPFYRELMGKTFNRIVRLLAVRGIRDTQCGFKLVQGEVGRKIATELTVDRFAYDVELIWLARRHGCEVAEVGVVWINSPDSRVSPVASSLSALLDVIRFRFRHRGKP
jgi:dolichyl-phosphate beta-glucosyltransferase